MTPSILCDRCNNLFSKNLIVEQGNNYYCLYCFEKFIAQNIHSQDEKYRFSDKHPKVYRVIKVLYRKEIKLIFHFLYAISLAFLVYLANQKIFSNEQLIISLIILNLPYILFIWSFVFADFDDFMESIWYLYRWDLISMIKGEIQKDWNEERGFNIWFIASWIIIVAEFMLINILKWQF